MGSYNFFNDNQMSQTEAIVNPEKKLWRAVLNQAVEDGFGLYTTYMTDLEKIHAKRFVEFRTSTFDEICEHADVDADTAWKRIQKMKLIQKGIVNADNKREIHALRILEEIKQLRGKRATSHRKSNRLEGGAHVR